MSCRETENLLPRYTEGDLSAREERLVESHLETCAQCRESHAVYLSLEKSLAGLKTELPAPEIVARKVMRRVRGAGRRRRFSPAAIWSFPVIANFLLIMAGIIFYTYREAIGRIAPVIGNGFVRAIENFSESLPQWISQAAGGDPWVLAAVLVLCALLMTLTGGLAVTRFAVK
jgi:anti-sigma factor RsiW